MIGKAMQAALNEQVNAEFYSAYLYLAISGWCEQENLPGHGAWMRKQAREELEHGMRFYGHITDRDGAVTLTAVDKPPATFKSPLDIWEKALAHERSITARIHALCELAAKEKDHAALEMLQWFVREQVEEEKTANGFLEQVKLLNGRGPALFFLDRHLGKAAGEKE
ncbi:MAG TPA: ferritin [Gemmatimonadaceae bacterium]|nr:ferritin [Gemmatimonadaceae bacterium]